MTRIYTKGEVRNIINQEVKRLGDFINIYGLENEINHMRYSACESLNKNEYNENEVREIRNEVSNVLISLTDFDN